MRRRAKLGNQRDGLTEEVGSTAQDGASAGREGYRQARGNSATQAHLQGGGPTDATDLNAALHACFGPSISGIDLQTGSRAEAAALGGEAFTDGHKVHMGGLSPTADDPHALEVLGHEVAHALAGGGSGEELLSRREDPGEQRAEDAGRRFSDWVSGGMNDGAPSLSPAHGGKAVIHRFESVEHQDAVDGALERARYSDDPSVAEAARQSSSLLDPSEKIILGNDVEVTPGQITAMMGDFYGIFDKNGDFNAEASFEQMWNGNPDDMQALLALLDKEKGGEEIAPDEWSKALKNRKAEGDLSYTDKNGQQQSHQQLGYLDLASRNSNHFSTKNTAGTDNNLGAYSAFHQMALEEAQTQSGLAGDAQDVNRLRALESCGMHYLTDRHASGHTFDKDGVMQASGYMDNQWTWTGPALAIDAAMGKGSTANLFVKAVHDDWNAQGIQVDNTKGESWLAQGDGHWFDGTNGENRDRTAQSVVTSFAEVQSVLDGGSTAADAKQKGYGAFDTVPAWSDKRQKQAEQSAADKTFAGVAANQGAHYGQLYGGRALENQKNFRSPGPVGAGGGRRF